MADTRNIKCYIKPTIKGKGNISNLALRIDNKDITATTDDKGIATFELEIANNELAKHIYLSIDSDEYVLDNHNHCVPIQHTQKINAFPLSLNFSVAIASVKIYKKENVTQDNQTQEIQKEIAIAQVDSNTQTPQEQIIYLESMFIGQNAKQDEGKLPKIQYSYVIQSLNEPLPSPTKAKPLTFTSHTPSNRIISFNLNTQFTYTENNSQKEITGYLKDTQRLILFAYIKKPAYQTPSGKPHCLLHIDKYPILELSYGTARLIMQDKEKNKDFAIKHSIMSYLITHFNNPNTPYTITKKDSHLLISNANNKTFEIHKCTQQEAAQQESTRQSQAAQSQSLQEDTKIYIDNTEFDNLAILTALLTLNENNKVSLSLRLCYQITLDMLKEVFEYTKAQDGIKTKMDTMLLQMVEELNRMQDNKPMYMHYNLDTRARLEHVSLGWRRGWIIVSRD